LILENPQNKLRAYIGNRIMDEKLISRVTVLAIGVEKYQNLKPLKGPSKDIQNLRHLLLTSPETAIFKKPQYIEVINPTSEELRTKVNQYVQNRSANGDILIFYFSGHGMPVGRNDFGFCTIDTAIHPGAETVLPLTLFKFSDLLSSISIMDIIPIIIVDACYSGWAGKALIAPYDVITTMRDEITKTRASNYALLCSCSDSQSTLDSVSGGIFSNSIFQVISAGLPKSKEKSHLLGLKQIYQNLSRKVEANALESAPRLYIGDTLPDFPLAKNIQYHPQSYSFTGHLKTIVEALWNKGSERELSTSEIDEVCGKGAYGNHSKLSLEPWQLVDDNPENRKRRLTDRGRRFATGEITIPKDIEKDPISQKWLPARNSPQISFQSE
jgi:hypothetical protein